MGATEIVLTARAGNQAVLSMMLAAGMRGRIRMAGRPDRPASGARAPLPVQLILVP